jgi:large subunit ribosomal protein L22
MQASLSDYRQSPRKVRLVVDLVRGKNVRDALTSLTFLDKRAALPIKKLIESAFANAKSQGADQESLVISKIEVNKGIVLKRMMPRARGSAARIKKRSSHVTLTLAPHVPKEEKGKKSKEPSSETVVKKVAKKIKA